MLRPDLVRKKGKICGRSGVGLCCPPPTPLPTGPSKRDPPASYNAPTPPFVPPPPPPSASSPPPPRSRTLPRPPSPPPLKSSPRNCALIKRRFKMGGCAVKLGVVTERKVSMVQISQKRSVNLRPSGIYGGTHSMKSPGASAAMPEPSRWRRFANVASSRREAQRSRSPAGEILLITEIFVRRHQQLKPGCPPPRLSRSPFSKSAQPSRMPL